MLKKSLCLPLVCVLPLTTYAQTSSTEQPNISHSDKVIPSKTYFLMAVDNRIKQTIPKNDIGKLLGMPDISKVNAEIVFYGMRKSMLKYAARAWDAGLAVRYGKEVGEMIGLPSTSSESVTDDNLLNKFLLFRYAQQHPESKSVLQKYQRQLTREVADIDMTPTDFGTHCAQLESYSDFMFYRSLGQLSVSPSRVYSVTEQYESLPPCKKQQVENSLSSTTPVPSLSDFVMIVTSNLNTP